MISEGGCLIGEAAKVMGLRPGRNKIAASIKRGSQGDSLEEQPDQDSLSESGHDGETSNRTTEPPLPGSKSYGSFFQQSGYLSISQQYAELGRELKARTSHNLQQEGNKESDGVYHYYFCRYRIAF